MSVLRTLLGLGCALACGAAASQSHSSTFAPGTQGLGISASGDTALLALRPLKRGSLGLTMGRLDGGLGFTRAEGFNLSLIGQWPVSQALELEGRLGANYGRPDTSAQGAFAFGDGLAYGAGLRWNFTSRASATIGWDSQELGFPGSGRETIRATRLGLQLRY